MVTTNKALLEAVQAALKDYFDVIAHKLPGSRKHMQFLNAKKALDDACTAACIDKDMEPSAIETLVAEAIAKLSDSTPTC